MYRSQGRAKTDQACPDDGSGLILVRSNPANHHAHFVADIAFRVCHVFPLLPNQLLKHRAREHGGNAGEACLTLYPADVLFCRSRRLIRLFVVEKLQIGGVKLLQLVEHGVPFVVGALMIDFPVNIAGMGAIVIDQDGLYIHLLLNILFVICASPVCSGRDHFDDPFLQKQDGRIMMIPPDRSVLNGQSHSLGQLFRTVLTINESGIFPQILAKQLQDLNFHVVIGKHRHEKLGHLGQRSFFRVVGAEISNLWLQTDPIV